MIRPSGMRCVASRSRDILLAGRERWRHDDSDPVGRGRRPGGDALPRGCLIPDRWAAPGSGLQSLRGGLMEAVIVFALLGAFLVAISGAFGRGRW